MSENTPYHEDGLLPLIVQGDERAFSRLYHTTNAGIYNAVMTYVKDEQMARELVQVIYIKVWDHRESLKNVRSLKDYLFILSRNTVFDHLEKLTREARCRTEHHRYKEELHNNVLSHIQERENDHLLKEVIAQLPPRQREVYLLANEQDMSYAEIAEHMQVSRLTVKRHLELARRFIRKYFHEHIQQPTHIYILFLLPPIGYCCRLLA